MLKKGAIQIDPPGKILVPAQQGMYNILPNLKNLQVWWVHIPPKK